MAEDAQLQAFYEFNSGGQLYSSMIFYFILVRKLYISLLVMKLPCNYNNSTLQYHFRATINAEGFKK